MRKKYSKGMALQLDGTAAGTLNMHSHMGV